MRRLVLLICLWAGMASAGPEVSKRPVLRPVPGAVPVEVAPSGTLVPATRAPAAEEAARRGGGLFGSLRPILRTRKAERAGRERQKLVARGAVCGDPGIQGEPVGRVSGSLQGCGVENAVRVRSVAGIGLSQAAVIDCPTAKALKTWVERSARPALRQKGGGLAGLQVAAHYACRGRNNQKGARISEHGKGRAIDISGFRLQNGAIISVLEGWRAQGTRKPLRQMHQGACGPFGTVLGPDADRHHQDHFHFDTARYRSGSYCK